MTIHWRCEPFSSLSGTDVHAILKLRQDVFVLEQTCLYPDIDGKDTEATHLLAERNGEGLIACARLFAPGNYYAEAAVGRVVVAASARGGGLARVLMNKAHQEVERLWGTNRTRLGGQAYLKAFYESLGYEAVVGPYDEDGIPHYEMVRDASAI